LETEATQKRQAELRGFVDGFKERELVERVSLNANPPVELAGLASEVARLKARFVIKDSDESMKGAA